MARKPKRLPEVSVPGSTPFPVATNDLDALNAAAARLTPEDSILAQRVPPEPWHEPDPLSPLGLYFNHLAGPGHRKAASCLEHIQVIDSTNGRGKTTLLLAEVLAFFMNCHPTRKRTRAVRILVIAPSRFQLAMIYTPRIMEASAFACPDSFSPNLKTIAGGPMLDLEHVRVTHSGRVPKLDIAWTPGSGARGLSRMVHRDGTVIIFHISGDKNSWKRIESDEFDAIFRDEATGNESLGDTLRTRLRTSWADTDGITGGGFYKWYFTFQDAPPEAMDTRRRARDEQAFHAFTQLGSEDNCQAVTQKTREEIGSTMSKRAAEIRMYGTRDLQNDLLIFGNHFNRERHVLAQHHEPSERANLWVSWDPGLRHPCAILFACLEPDFPAQIIIWAAIVESGLTIDNQAGRIAAMLDGRFLTGFVYDHHGATQTNTALGKRQCDLMEEGLAARGVKVKRGLEAGNSSYDLTFQLMWTYLDPQPGNPLASPLLVVNPPSPQAPGTDELIEGMYRYRWKDPGIHTLAREAVVCEDDDAVSAARYLLSMQPRWSDQGITRRRSTAPLGGVAGLPYPIILRSDSLADDATLTPELRAQRAALRESRRLMAEHRKASGGGQRRMPVVWTPHL